MYLGGGVFFVLWLLNARYSTHHSWLAAIIGALFAALFWIVVMTVVDRRRRKSGRSPMFPDGSIRDNFRAGWAAERYGARQWLGYSAVFAAFAALSLYELVSGNSIATGVLGTALFGLLLVVCLVQAARSTGTPSGQ
jgi:peptidoglycan/LPS O-acetylase OafA/YrhL